MRTIESYEYSHPEQGLITAKKIVARDADGAVESECFLHPMTAEEWLEVEGLTPLRLITLLYLEMQVAAANAQAPKLQAVRDWVNGLLGTFALDPSPREGWTLAPFPFEETVQEALASLNA